ncbi:hypothetical protein AB0D40_41410 [Streptomyces massasporeus]|uniref:hypothetical protein n=1 Tax=Streptomyces massasporeus TaxID=67324 RepID=UPI0033E8A053
MKQPDAVDPDEAQTVPGPLLLTFLVALPFPCPLPHGAVISKMLPGTVEGLEGVQMHATQDGPAPPTTAQGRPFVSLKFWQLMERQSGGSMHLPALAQVCAEIIGKPAPEDLTDGTVEAYRTVVEMVTVQSADRLHPQEEALHEAFTRCFDVLTDVSAMAKLALPHSHPVAAPEQIAVTIWLARTLTGSYADGWMGVKPLTPPSGPLDAVLDEDQMTRLNTHLHRLWDGSPFELAMERSTEANRAFRHEGDYRNAVVQAAMFAEIILTSTLSLMLWEEQLHAPSIEKAVAVFDFSRGGGLATRVKTEYAPRLGGTWDSTRPGPIHDWAHAVAALRNRVVHRGYRPTYQETEAALAAADALPEFIKTRLAQRVARYPRTALLTLGELGLRRLGGWSRANAYLTDPTQVPDLWFREFAAWREAVDRRLA